MPHTPESDGGEGRGARPGDELSARLLGRGAGVGVVNVGWVQRQYSRTADWMAERFAVLGDLSARYGTVDSRAAGSAAPLPMARGDYVRAESETTPPADDHTPTGGGLERAAEVSAPHAGEAGGGGAGAQGGGSGPTLQRKSKASEHAPAPPEKSAPLVSQESAPESAAPPTLMRLAAESPAAESLAAESPAAESPSPATGGDVSAAELTLETPHAVAQRETRADAPSVSDAPSVPDARPTAREVVPSVSAKQETTIQPTFAPERGSAEGHAGAETAASAETATSSERQSLPLAREEGPRASPESAATIMRAARGAESATPIQRAAESAMLIQRAAAGEADAATNRAVETTSAASNRVVETTSAASPSTPGAEHPTVGHATERAAAHAAEVRAQPHLSAPEILRSPSLPLAARMVWRKSVGGGGVTPGTPGTPDAARSELPYVNPAQPSPSAASTQMLYRAEAPAPVLARAASDGEGVESAAPAASVSSAQSGAGGLSLEQITEYVSRVILRRIAVERERRGARRWL